MIAALEIIACWLGTSILFVGAVLIFRAICQKFSSGKPRRRSWQALERMLLPR